MKNFLKNNNVKEALKKSKLSASVGRTDKQMLSAMRSAIRQMREKLNTSRENFGASLLGTFIEQGATVDTAAESLIRFNLIAVPDHEIRNASDLLNFYSFHTIAVFTPLADNLTYDEEEALSSISAQVRDSWRKFFGAVRLRRGELFDSSLKAEEAMMALQDFMDDFYLGEIESELDEKYATAMYEVRDFLDKLLQKGAQ